MNHCIPEFDKIESIDKNESLLMDKIESIDKNESLTHGQEFELINLLTHFCRLFKFAFITTD